MSRKTIKIHGSISRNCENCGQDRECICFETKDKKTHVMCNACTYEEYGYGKLKKDKDTFGKYELCKYCNTVTMKRLRLQDEVTGTHVIHHFTCDTCGRKMNKKIRKWKK